MKVKICMLFLTLSCLAAAALYAETIYSWTDENGVRHMTSIPPSDATGKVEIIQLKPVPHQTFAPPSLQKEAAASQTVGTPIAIHRDHVIVPTTLIHKNVTIEANLLLDTESTNIALHKEVARHLSLKNFVYTIDFDNQVLRWSAD